MSSLRLIVTLRSGTPPQASMMARYTLIASPGIREQVSAIEKYGFYPVVMSGFGPRDWHDLATYFKGYTGATVGLGPLARAIPASYAES